MEKYRLGIPIPKFLLFIMRITLFLFVIGVMQMYAVDSYAQKTHLTINENNIKLGTLFNKIESQTDFYFFYNNDIIDKDLEVSVNVANKTIFEILNIALRGTDITYQVNNKAIILSIKDNNSSVLSVLQVKKQISGVVTDENGEPIIGANVMEKGTTNGTVTDINGNYIISVSDDAVLIVSYIGYLSQDIITSEKRVVNVLLVEDTHALEELVVVGYGAQRKIDLTGSVSSLSGDALLTAPTPNLTNTLAGKMTGVITSQQSGKPGDDAPLFYIRGKSTWGDNATLTIVDGVERPINQVDPNDIESVSVLKDAASAAIYGARAANGVILITTKRGSGKENKLNYSSLFGMQTPTIKPKMMNSYQYAKYLNLARHNIGSQLLFTQDQIDGYKNGALVDTDWWDASLHKYAPMHQHSITLNGGADKTKYFISVGYLDQGGLYDLASFQRYNVRSNIDTQISNYFTLGFDLSGRLEDVSDAASGDGVFSTVLNSAPTEAPYTPNHIAEKGLQANGQNVSPIGIADHSGYAKRKVSSFNSNFKATYVVPWVDGLEANFSYSYDRAYARHKTFTDVYDYYIHDRLSNTYDKKTSGGGKNLHEVASDETRTTLQTSLNYQKVLADNHKVVAVLVYEESKYTGANLSASRYSYYSSSIPEIFAGPEKDQKMGGYSWNNARKGYAGRVNYAYKDRYLLQANFRVDGSYNFHPDNRWGFFPAVSAGWRVSEEPFVKNLNVFDNLKLRVSYGEFGNDRIQQFQYLSAFVTGASSVIGDSYIPGLQESVLPNKDVTWETARNIDVGLDWGVLGGRLSGEFTYFKKYTRDILMVRDAVVPESAGVAGLLPQENHGKVNNYGLEALLRYADKWGDFGLTVEANTTFARSKIIYIGEADGVNELQRRTGRPFDQFFGYKAEGIFKTQEEVDSWADQSGFGAYGVGDIKYANIDDNDGRNIIDGNDITAIGRSQIPELVYGLNLNFSYKNLSLTTNWQGAAMFDQMLRWDPFNLDANALAIFMNSWSIDNQNAKYPKLYAGMRPNNRVNSSLWLYDGTYVRLRNLELAYSFDTNKEWLKRAHINGLRMFVSGNNLLTFSAMKDFDPESPQIEPGQRSYFYPQMRTYNFGINIQF